MLYSKKSPLGTLNLVDFIVTFQAQADTGKSPEILESTDKWGNYRFRLCFRGSRGELVLQQLGHVSAWYHRLRRRTGGVKVGCDYQPSPLFKFTFLCLSVRPLRFGLSLFRPLCQLFINSLFNVLPSAQSVLSNSQVLPLRDFTLIGLYPTLLLVSHKNVHAYPQRSCQDGRH